MLDEKVELLLNKEENRGLLEGLEQASRRVKMAKRELAEIEKQEIEAKSMRDYVTQLELRASEAGSGIGGFLSAVHGFSTGRRNCSTRCSSKCIVWLLSDSFL